MASNIIYDTNNRPRTLLFDYSTKIQPYYLTNDKPPRQAINSLKDCLTGMSNIQLFESEREESNYINLQNMITRDLDQELKPPSSQPEDEEALEEKNKLNSILKLNDEELYDYLDFEHNVKNWNDFLQPKFPKGTLNQINVIDIEEKSMSSLVMGREFSRTKSYFEDFEDNFRKKLENCDRLEILNINADFNTFWGGISLSFLETIHEMIPKVLKVYNGIDSISSFTLPGQNMFNLEKHVNYVWFLSDLFEIEGTNVLFTPIYQNETPNLIKDIFGYSPQKNVLVEDDPVHDFYFSALCGLELQHMYLPLRSMNFGKSNYLRNLSFNYSQLNIFESDIILNIESSYNNFPKDQVSNGTFASFQRNTKLKTFSWKSQFQKSFAFNQYSSSIIYGYKTEYKMLGEKYGKFFEKLSKIIFASEDKLKLPMCFPKKFVANSKGEKVFKKDISYCANIRPFVDFVLTNLKDFESNTKNYDLSANKYLSHIEQGKYFEYKEKVENVFNTIYTYKDYAENILNIFDHDSDDSDIE